MLEIQTIEQKQCDQPVKKRFLVREPIGPQMVCSSSSIYNSILACNLRTPNKAKSEDWGVDRKFYCLLYALKMEKYINLLLSGKF